MRTFALGICLVLVAIQVDRVSASKSCHHCSGSNCQRIDYNRTETCVNEMDICVTIFDGSAIHAQGCMQSMAENLRKKCKPNAVEQCHMCLTDMCNDMGPKDYECIQCDSETDERCRSDPAVFKPMKCPLSRAYNVYCYVNEDGNRTTRGCAGVVQEQKDCLSRSNCAICSPMDFKACNVLQIEKDEGGNNGGNDGGNDGGNNGGNDGGNDGGNSESSTIILNIITLVICLVAVAFGTCHS